MKCKLNVFTLAMLAQAGMMSAVMAQGFDLSQANTSKVKFDKWVCKACKAETGVNGNIGVGLGYQHSDDIRAANAMGTDNELAAKLDADVRYSNEQGYNAEFNADNLGMDNSRAQLSAGQAGHYQVNANFRQITTFDTDNALTPYLGVGSDQLNLPSNWVTAGSTSAMTQLATDLYAFDMDLKRQRYGLGFEYQSEQLWQTYINYEREQKKGLKTSSGSFFNQSMMLAEPVDYTTDMIEAGISFNGQNWFTALNYNGSRFSNQYSQLSFDNAFNPTFGAQTVGVMALDPDNESHIVSLQGQYRFDTTRVNGRVLYGQMSQDQQFVTQGYAYALPQQSANAEVDLLGINLKAQTRISRDLKLSAVYDYNERDNTTQVEQWTQISINDVTGQVAYNTPYDFSYHSAKLAADYRIVRGVKFAAGFDYRRDDRDYQDREITDDSTLWSSLRITKFADMNLFFKASYGLKDGSRYQASELTSSESNALLRKYNLADRERTQVEARFSYSVTPALSVDLGARYALDDYDETVIGLTESKDLSLDSSINYLITDDIDIAGFYSYQTIKLTQAGSDNFSSPTWQAAIEDQINVVGLNLAYRNLLQDKLTLGLDYTYSDSNSDTQVTQGITGNYGDYFAKVHNANLYANYQVSEQLGLRLDYKYERYQDNDAAQSGQVDEIWNVLTFGNNSHNYNAQLVMLSVNYRL